jgi:hypothetical protein
MQTSWAWASGGAGLGAALERRASAIQLERKGSSGAARQPCRQMSRPYTRGLSCTARFSAEWQIARIYKSTAPRTHRVRAPAVTDSVAAHRASIREGALPGGLGWHTTTGGEKAGPPYNSRAEEFGETAGAKWDEGRRRRELF